jgi:hypothetical protein
VTLHRRIKKTITWSHTRNRMQTPKIKLQAKPYYRRSWEPNHSLSPAQRKISLTCAPNSVACITWHSAVLSYKHEMNASRARPRHLALYRVLRSIYRSISQALLSHAKGKTLFQTRIQNVQNYLLREAIWTCDPTVRSIYERRFEESQKSDCTKQQPTNKRPVQSTWNRKKTQQNVARGSH